MLGWALTFMVLALVAGALGFGGIAGASASIAQVHRAVTTDGRQVAVKVRRPGIDKQFARDIETYEWAAAHLEALGGEAARLRPRQVIANFRRWTLRELDLLTTLRRLLRSPGVAA